MDILRLVLMALLLTGLLSGRSRAIAARPAPQDSPAAAKVQRTNSAGASNQRSTCYELATNPPRSRLQLQRPWGTLTDNGRQLMTITTAPAGPQQHAGGEKSMQAHPRHLRTH